MSAGGNMKKKGYAAGGMTKKGYAAGGLGMKKKMMSAGGMPMAKDPKTGKTWVGQLEELWWSVGQADIEQATEALKAGRQFLPEMEDDSPTSIDPLLQEYGFE